MGKEKKKSTFWADFKKFITKGNVLDMAIGVVIGGAFGKITSGLVNLIISPVIGLLTGGVNLNEALKVILVPAEIEILADGTEKILKAEVAMQFGAWLQFIIDFLIIAFCMFLILRVFTKAQAKINEKQLEEAAAAAAEKAAADKAAADAAAAVAAAAAAEKKAAEDQFYANVAEQTELLRQIKESMNK